MRKGFYFFSLIGCLTLALSCADKSLVTLPDKEVVEQEEKTITSRWELFRAYADHEIVILYDTKDQKLQQQYESAYSQFVASISPEFLDRFKISLHHIDTISPEEIDNKIMFMVGAFQNHKALDNLGEMIPFGKEESSFSFNNSVYNSPGDAFVLQNFPDPINKRLPFTLITGNSDSAIFSIFEEMLSKGSRFLRNSFDFSVYQGRHRSIIGAFDYDWKIKEDHLFEFKNLDKALISNDQFDIFSHNNALSTTELEKVSLNIEKRIHEIQGFLGTTETISKFNFHIYKSAEEKGLQKLNSKQSHIDFNDNSVHTIFNEKYQDNFIEKENQLVIRHLLGEPTLPVLESGLAISFTDKWQREGYRYWAAQLATSGNALTLIELTNQELLQQESPLIRDCMAGVFVDFLIEQWGKDSFLSKYKNWIPSQIELENLSPSWDTYLHNLSVQHPKKQRTVRTDLGLKGFNFAHEGYRIFNGYMSKLASQAIQKQLDLGSNAIAIVPYSYMRDDQKPIPLSIPQGPGQENDEGVIYSAYETKKRGMRTMLKPQIFLRDGWPGSIQMKSDEDWASFYKYYQKWIIHYALLGEIHEIDMLSVGVEFVQSTLRHEEEWRHIIKSARGLFSGQITYCANWGDEFENLSFGDALDFIGINSYYPLSKKDEVSDAELRSNFDSIKDKIKVVHSRYQKPIVFTEIGFRSIDAPWKNPHARGDGSYNEEHQERCYRIILEGIQDEAWYGGILWWKYPSYLDYGGDENDSFTPHNKLAEKTIQTYFSRQKVQ